MINVTNTTIKIPKGESAKVQFYIKDTYKDYPYILGPLNQNTNSVSGEIIFMMRDGKDVRSKEILKKTFDLSTFNAPSWHRFASNEIIEENKIMDDTDEAKASVNADNKLYRYLIGNNKVNYFVFKESEAVEYAYENSSVIVTFDTKDTINLVPKIYYYNIAYIERNANSEIVYKQTLLNEGLIEIGASLV